MASKNSSSIDASSLFRVDGLVALVTGGGSGIGYMLAKALAQNGASKVYIAGRRLEVLEKAASTLGANVHPVQCDVTSKESLSAAAATIEKESGYLNLLVCNSGVAGPQTGIIKEDMTLEEWTRVNWEHDMEDYTQTLRVNTSSVWYTTMAFLQLLSKGNDKANVGWTSQVIMIGSVAAYNKKAPGGWAYGQSKAATTHAMKQLSVVLPQWGMRANCIAPGLFPSEMSAPIFEEYAGGAGQDTKVPKAMIPLGRAGDEQDMGATMLYLASRAGSYLNGATIRIDGGRLTTFPSTD